MNRKKILDEIKALDESGVYPYLYDVMVDGSAKSEEWLSDLEDMELKTSTDLINALIELSIV